MRYAALGFAVAALLAPVATVAAAPGKTIELVLDASGSMNARLASGETRIAAAKAAVARVAATLPADTTLALRAYGHRSPREKHDCDDTALLVPFGLLADNRAAVVRAAEGLAARGYTPISRVLRLAAGDLAGKPGEKVIVLVSDGKETCDTDPCATARALKAADVSLVIHAIGFEVDSAARGELACVAQATGGSYFDAAGVDGLATALGQASVRGGEAVAPMSGEPGNLEIKNAEMRGHKVLDAVTGAVVGDISSFRRVIQVPPGVYNVTFGKGLWRGVEVRSGGITVLEPAVLAIEGASMNGHKVLDSETGTVLDELSSFHSTVPFLPGLYDVIFGGAVWRHIRLDGGVTTRLRPGLLEVTGATMNGHKVYDEAGKEVGNVSSMGSRIPLPPGSYSIDLAGRRVPFTLAEGQKVTLSAK
ncbi:MAG TPA: VWA domain-containing protein [Thermoanaerobaculia bacterium]|nr:VWA domain-containing protein [Thermoanaerobaculia bacterium]